MSKEKFVRDKPHVNIGTIGGGVSTCDYLNRAEFSFNTTVFVPTDAERTLNSVQYPYRLEATRNFSGSNRWRALVMDDGSLRDNTRRLTDPGVDCDGIVDLVGTFDRGMKTKTVLELTDCQPLTWSTTVDNEGFAVEHLAFGCVEAIFSEPTATREDPPVRN